MAPISFPDTSEQKEDSEEFLELEEESESYESTEPVEYDSDALSGTKAKPPI